MLHMFPLIYSLSLSLFVSLFLFVSCFVWALFYAGRYVYVTSLVLLPCRRGIFDDDVPPHISIIEFSTVRRLPSFMLFVAVAFACDP